MQCIFPEEVARQAKSVDGGQLRRPIWSIHFCSSNVQSKQKPKNSVAIAANECHWIWAIGIKSCSFTVHFSYRQQMPSQPIDSHHFFYVSNFVSVFRFSFCFVFISFDYLFRARWITTQCVCAFYGITCETQSVRSIWWKTLFFFVRSCIVSTTSSGVRPRGNNNKNTMRHDT